MSRSFFAALMGTLALGVGSVAAQSVDWHYNGGPSGDHYTPLKQITADNVGQLKPAWKFDFEPGGLQAQPLMIGRLLYGATPSGKLVALNAATGVLKWTFDPAIPGGQPIRGLVSHGTGPNMRLLFGTQNYLYALDGQTGKPIMSFGRNGRIDINENLRGPAEKNGMFLTSPGSVYKDLYIAIYDMNGVVLAHGTNRHFDGAEAINIKDPDGKPYVRDMIASVSNKDSGWVSYKFAHPVTADIREKSVFVARFEDAILTCGCYVE